MTFMPVSWKVDPASISKLQRELSEIPRKVILKGGRRGMVLWAEEVKASIRSNLSTVGFDSASIRRSIVHKIVRLKRGKGLWVGVGVAAGKAWGTRNFYIAHLARWYETGWTPYPKGRPTDKTGKNWRKGVRVGSGARIYSTDFIQKSTKPAWQTLPDYIAKAVQAELNKPEKL
jgi:hypothetical protein